MNKLFVAVDDSGKGFGAVPELLNIALDFGLQEDFKVFELELSLLSKSFIEELNSKPFILTPITKEYKVRRTGPNSMTMPIVGVKGILNKESAEFLASKTITGKLFLNVLKILLREPQRNEPKDFFVINKLYKRKKALIMLTNCNCLQGQLTENQIEKLYHSAKKEGAYSAYFLPRDDNVVISKFDPRVHRGPLPEVFHTDVDGKWIKTVEEVIPPLALVFNTANELRDARHLTSIQVTGFTKKKLVELSTEQNAKNYDRTIIKLMENDAYRQNKQKIVAGECKANAAKKQ